MPFWNEAPVFVVQPPRVTLQPIALALDAHAQPAASRGSADSVTGRLTFSVCFSTMT
jgi:hypothetical protein